MLIFLRQFWYSTFVSQLECLKHAFDKVPKGNMTAWNDLWYHISVGISTLQLDLLLKSGFSLYPPSCAFALSNWLTLQMVVSCVYSIYPIQPNQYIQYFVSLFPITCHCFHYFSQFQIVSHYFGKARYQNRIPMEYI